MIITADIFNQWFPNDPNSENDIANLGLPKEYNDIISMLQSNGDPDELLNNFIRNLPILIKDSGNYTLGGYRVLDPVSKQYLNFSNLEDANAQWIKSGTNFVAANPKFFSVNEENIAADGSVSWSAVSIDSLATLPDTTYQVYDYTTNSYTIYTTTAATVAAVTALKNKLASEFPSVQQQITSSDGLQSSWVPVQ